MDGSLHAFAPGLYTAGGPTVSFFGFPYPTRMAVIRLADELHDTAEASDTTYGELERHFTTEQILELVVTAGWYHTISFVIGAARIAPEPWAARFPR